MTEPKDADGTVTVTLSELRANRQKVDHLVFAEHKEVRVMSAGREIGVIAAFGGDTGRRGYSP